MKKQGMSPKKIIKCGYWIAKEKRWMTIREYNAFRKMEDLDEKMKINKSFKILPLNAAK